MTSSVQRTPPVGGLREIAGRRVFVHRAGAGGPAVVFLPGAGAVGLDYYGVQQRVATFTTAVVYDRGSTGYSDPLPPPRTAAAVATELRELLRAERIDGPYVLAAHSLGGLYAHRFAQLYPQDVAGLVWLDALHRDWDRFMPPALHLAAIDRVAPDRDQLDRMRPALRVQRAELLADYPEHVRDALIDAKDSAAWLDAGVAERGLVAGLARELRAGPALPDVPLIAVTVLDPASTPPEMLDGRTTMDAALVAAVSHGEQRLLSGTVHHRLCFDRPDAVAQAIRDVVGQAA
jgi:pimeloyl-ACP methyl ester carboxylesterase